MNPTLDEIAVWLAGHGYPAEWAVFLDGLPQAIIEPGCKIARASKTHPAMALGAVAVYTGDQAIRGTIRDHLARHTPDVPDAPQPNRATRRAATRSQRRAR